MALISILFIFLSFLFSNRNYDEFWLPQCFVECVCLIGWRTVEYCTGANGECSSSKKQNASLSVDSCGTKVDRSARTFKLKEINSNKSNQIKFNLIDAVVLWALSGTAVARASRQLLVGSVVSLWQFR